MSYKQQFAACEGKAEEHKSTQLLADYILLLKKCQQLKAKKEERTSNP
jgi:hypothetical protein